RPLPFTSPVPSFDDFQVAYFLVFPITLIGGVQQFRRNLENNNVEKQLKLIKSLYNEERGKYYDFLVTELNKKS
ncbi:MAG: hypothetical protein ACTSR2_05380, partial [Candidatus Hodarchaeales archaeon]